MKQTVGGRGRRAGRRLALWLAAMLLTVSVPALSAAAVSGTELVENGSRYDGAPVVYRGEAIGEVMRRGRVALLNVHDGTYALGVWAPVRTAAVIRKVGRSGVIGDVVEVRGTFNRACPVHGGDLDIHAESLTVVTPGRDVREPLHRNEAVLAFALILIALLLAGWERLRALRRQNSETL